MGSIRVFCSYSEHSLKKDEVCNSAQNRLRMCGTLDNPDEARKQLITEIADRVFVYDQRVMAIALHGNWEVILDEDLSIPSEVLEQGAEEIKSGNITNSVSTHCGSDGHRCLLGIQFVLFRLVKLNGVVVVSVSSNSIQNNIRDNLSLQAEMTSAYIHLFSILVASFQQVWVVVTR